MSHIKNTHDRGLLGTTTKPSLDWSIPHSQFKLTNGEVFEIISIVVHEFLVDGDPNITAANELWEWQNSESGKWVIEHSIEPPKWRKIDDHRSIFSKVYIVACLKSSDVTFWNLKWGKPL